MMDPIDRQAAIDEAVAYIEEWNNAQNKHHKKEITRRFQNLPSAQPKEDIKAMCGECDARNQYKNYPQPRWIPCSERLPDKEKKPYWICTKTGYQCECRWSNNVYGLGESDKWEWSIFDIPPYAEVVAWMPLPEPYKERRENDGTN